MSVHAENNAAQRAWSKHATGCAEDAVRKACEDGGTPFRVTRRDGHAIVVTRDYDPERVNVYVETGVVTKVYFG